MLRRNSVLVLLTLFISLQTLFAQSSIETFMPSGGPIITVFSNFHAGLGDDKYSAFEVRRAYLGYDYSISKNFRAIVKLDIGSPKDVSFERIAFFKNAALEYQKGNLKVIFGLIDLYQFKVQEKFWTRRYIFKSFNDENKFGSSADIGTSISYNFSGKFSADLTLMNGEGYKSLQIDNTYKAGFGLTYIPIMNLTLRVYYDVSDKNITQSTLAGFVGYTYKKKATIGLEYNYLWNNNFTDGHDRFGYSFYGSYIFNEKFELFGRLDKVKSNILIEEDQPWNFVKDGNILISGIQFTPVKRVKIALSYQYWLPLGENLSNDPFIYLNVGFKL